MLFLILSKHHDNEFKTMCNPGMEEMHGKDEEEAPLGGPPEFWRRSWEGILEWEQVQVLSSCFIWGADWREAQSGCHGHVFRCAAGQNKS